MSLLVQSALQLAKFSKDLLSQVHILCTAGGGLDRLAHEEAFASRLLQSQAAAGSVPVSAGHLVIAIAGAATPKGRTQLAGLSGHSS